MKHHATGIEYWRSLEQLADSPEIRDMVSKEFPGYDADTIATTSRRSFLKFMGASLAMAGLTLSGCRRAPESKLAPYSANPRDRIPGVAEQYATAWELGGVATGLLVTSYDGRPIKIEGNPSHPFARTVNENIGSADAYAQASVLEMYDPERSRVVIDRTSGQAKPTNWDEFGAAMDEHFKKLRRKGSNFAILSEASSSPSVEAMRAAMKARAAFPNARWYEYEPITHDAEREGATLAYGQAVRPVLHLDKANVVVLLDADIMGTHPGHIRYGADWVTKRRSADNEKHREMSRVYLAETAYTITGGVADVRLPVDPSRLYPIARAIAAKLGVAGISGDEKLTDAEAKFVQHAAADLQKAGAAGVFYCGGAAPAEAHAVAFAINDKLGAVGQTVTLHADPAGDRPSHMQAIADLTKELNEGKVTTLLILGGNPAYDAPSDLDFAKALAKVPMTIRLGLYEDETSALCKWHLPRAHYLESWGDARALDGTPSIVQPLIEPLFGGKSVIEVLGIILGDTAQNGEEIVRRTWQEQGLIAPENFDKVWRQTLALGVLAGKAFEAVKPELKLQTLPPAPARAQGMYVRFLPDNRIYDGRFANNGWLQELPDTMTKLVWDNAALISKRDADLQGITTGDMVQVSVNGRWLDVAAFVMPGQPAGVLGLTLGYGRTASGNIGNGLGFNTYALRATKTPHAAGDASLRKTGRTYALASTQNHHIIDELGMHVREERVGKKGESGEIVREGRFADFAANPNSIRGEHHTVRLQMFESPHQFNNPHAWGMAIDMNACIGCNACVVACQAENNVPIVGKADVLRHRQMHWIRIDRYFKGSPDDETIEVVYQPMTCQHCENAPCEQVCPVAATVHDTEGLNTMVYNRCIGTRYCSNNCPYKVRRFNYFDYHAQDPRKEIARPWLKMPDEEQRESIKPIRQMGFNPEVTVRMRGVMEKCTYCVQRIHHVTIAKRAVNETVKDGDVITACQQACPTQAIVFGNLNDREAAVSRLHNNVRTYEVLEELNTRTRTKYLARLRNPVEGATTGVPGHDSKPKGHA